MRTTSKTEQKVIGVWSKHDKIGFKKAYKKLKETKELFGDNKVGYLGYLNMEIERYKKDVEWIRNTVSLEAVYLYDRKS